MPRFALFAAFLVAACAVAAIGQWTCPQTGSFDKPLCLFDTGERKNLIESSCRF